MNPKIVAAFVGGALVASGLVYVAVKPASTAKSALPGFPADYKLPSEQPALPASAAPETRTPAEPSMPIIGPPKTPPAPSTAKASVKATAEEKLPPALAAAKEPAPDPSPSPSLQTAAAPRPEPVREDVPPPPAFRDREPASVPVRAPQSVTLAPGTMVKIRVGETLSTKNLKSGDIFRATLAQPLVADGMVIAERGARAEGRVVEADKGGKLKKPAHLTLELTQVTTSDGQNVSLRSSTFVQQAKGTTGKDAAKVGAGAALGAIIGAVAGGGKGAGIGAGVGTAAGAGDVLLTKGNDAVIPVETQLSFTLSDQITITERLR